MIGLDDFFGAETIINICFYNVAIFFELFQIKLGQWQVERALEKAGIAREEEPPERIKTALRINTPREAIEAAAAAERACAVAAWDEASC